MPLWRYRGMWSQYFETITWAISPGPATPRAIGRLGAAAWKIVWQVTHASLGRTWRITKKCDGTYSSCSETSEPIWRSRPPQAVQPQAWPTVSRCAVVALGRCTWDSRGRCAGRLRSISGALAGVALAGAAGTGAGTAAMSIRLIWASSCSLEVPNSARTRRSSCSLSLSTISLSSATSESRTSTSRSSESIVGAVWVGVDTGT